MQGKYPSYSKYLAVKLQRALLRTVLRPLMGWSRLNNPRPGFSLIIACHAHFARMLLGNLRLLTRQDLDGLDQVLICFDAPRDATLSAFEEELTRAFPQFRIRCLYQSPAQAWVLQRIGWGWIDCWLSYAKGIGACQTRYAMLHDMDAMLLRRDLVASRIAALQERGDQFMGFRWYTGGGVVEEDQLCYIVEMALDVQFLRERFRPIDLFNHVTRRGERSIDYDTLLYPQTRDARRSVLSLDGEDWVHPGQVISQYTYLRRTDVYLAPAQNNLFFIPYFLHLSDDPSTLADHTAKLQAASRDNTSIVEFLDGKMDTRQLTRQHVDWILKQTHQVEHAHAGTVRPEVQDYLDAIEAMLPPSPL